MTRRAILSVYDKTGLAPFASALAQQGFELVASGGTARALRDAGLDVIDVQAVTASPEVLGGRVKTLHPAIHAGILSRRTPEDRAELARLGIAEIDLVVCNLYPFQQTIAQLGVTDAECVEQIDIGGVTLLRAAAKNAAHVAIVPSPGCYDEVLHALSNGEGLSPALRRRLAQAAFRLTAEYDLAISGWLDGEARISVAYERVQSLRYGENPHQSAALYQPLGQPAPFEQLAGKPLSYNNLVDMDAAREAVGDFARPTIAIIKHTNPCGLASADDLVTAFAAALASDPVSAFGSIVAANRPVDLALCEAIGTLYVEVIVAPSVDADALAWLQKKKKKCRVIVAPVGGYAAPQHRMIRGGLLVQDADAVPLERGDWRVVTKRTPSDEELRGLEFAWRVVKHVKSNAIVLCKAEATVGVGAGQMNRVDAVYLAARRAGDRSQGAVLASDAFFPFPDGVAAAAEAGVKALVQPGGSIRDDAVIAEADRLGLAMVFTGRRHFRH